MSRLIGATIGPHAARTDLQRYAERLVLEDLVNILLYENLFGIVERGILGTELGEPVGIPGFDLEPGELSFRLDLPSSGRSLLFRVRRQPFLQPYRLSRLPVILGNYEGTKRRWRVVGPAEILSVLAADHPTADGTDSLSNLDGCLADLDAAVSQTALSLEAVGPQLRMLSSGRHLSLGDWEQVAALRDRPFHPSARVKGGWNDADYRRFGAEFGHPFGLDWIAVRRDHIRGGPATLGLDIATRILDARGQRQLKTALRDAHISADTHLVLPVHPWQTQHLLTLYAEELATGTCALVARDLGQYFATSSVRSLEPSTGGPMHVKLPLGLYSLGALRLLPPRYLHNGEQGQHLLEHLIAKDHVLAQQLWFCDETRWWAFCQPEGDPFDDKPGHLACLLREYPSQFLDDPSISLVPMSALAVSTSGRSAPAAAYLLWDRGEHEPTAARVLGLFRELCARFTEVALRCFRSGIMPELHGQNVLLVFRAGRLTGLLLRDHDTVRMHLPWLSRAGIPRPDYLVNPGSPNTLIADTPENLLRYFQALGIQVNLYAIAQVLSQAYAIEEGAFWDVLSESLRHCLSEIDAPADVRQVAQRQLLEKETWPAKLALAPLLSRKGTGGGSMPSGWGVTRNPLRSHVAIGSVGAFA